MTYMCDLCGNAVEYPSDHKWMCAKHKGESEI